MRLVAFIFGLLLATGTAFSSPVEPGLFIPGAIRVELLSGGARRVSLADGAAALMRPTGEGFSVSFSDGRPGEQWRRISDGYSIQGNRGGHRRVYDRDLRATRSGYSDRREISARRTSSGYNVTRTESSGRFQHFPLRTNQSGKTPARR